MKFCFGDIVVVENNLIGVIVKCWAYFNGGYNYDVYVRNFNNIKNYKEDYIQRYMVIPKYLNEEEMEYQREVTKED